MSEISEARHEIIYGNSEEWKKDHLNYYTKLICFEAKLKSANRIKQLEDERIEIGKYVAEIQKLLIKESLEQK